VLHIKAHSARTFSTPRNRNWEAAPVCLSEQPVSTTVLSQSVVVFEAAVVELLLSHPLGSRSADFSGRCCPVLGASARHTSTPCASSRFRIGFVCSSPSPLSLLRLARDWSRWPRSGHQLALIVAALRQFVARQ